MSGTFLLSGQNGGAQGAPAAGAAAPAGVSTAGTAPGGSPFDAILMLEELAAGAADAGIDAGAAELGTDGAEAADTGDASADDEDNVELDNPLAFLAGLLAVTQRPHAQADGADAGASGGEGAGGVDALTAAKHDAAGLPLLANDGTNAADTSADDAAAAARALAAQTALAALDTRGKDDQTAPTRAVDLLTQTSRPAPAPADQPPIATHVRDPRWADDFSTRVALLVNQRESVAAISLTPMDLGPVDVSITVRDSQATIHFGAAQADTRALIEASLPKLRELLASQGFTLMDASVSQGFTRQPKSDAPSVPRPTSVDDVAPVQSRSITMNGLLDTYA